MSLNSKNLDRRNFFHRLNSIESNIPKRRNNKKNFGKIDKNINSYISSKNKKSPFFGRKKNCFNCDNKILEENPLSFDMRDNEEKNKLIKEINRSVNELKLQDKEIKKYQDLYGAIKEQNKTNQYILNQIIKEGKETKEENNKNDKSESKSENNLIKVLYSEKKKEKQLSDSKDNIIEPLSSRETDKMDLFQTNPFLLIKPTKNDLFSKTARDNIIKNNLFSSKSKEKENILNSIQNRKRLFQINFLKRELGYYNKAIDKENKKLEMFKKKEKTSKYIQVQNELDLQNKELEDLIKLYNIYQKKIKEYKTAIYFYKIKNNNYISSINDIKNRINKNYKSLNDDLEEDIPKIELDKKAFEENISLYKTKNYKIKKEIDEYKKKEKSLIEFIQNSLIILSERNKNNIEINNSYDLEIKLKKKLELKNTKLEKVKIINSDLNEYIKKLASNKINKFEDKIKYEQMEQEHIKKIKGEISDINREIQKNNYQNDVEENELKIEINTKNEILNEQKNEIEKLDKDEEHLKNHIDKLNKELKLITDNINNKNEELQKLNNLLNNNMIVNNNL